MSYISENIIAEELTKIQKSMQDRRKKEVELYGGILHPKTSNRFCIDIINDVLDEKEKVIFKNQVTNFNIQECFVSQFSNLFTLEIEEDVTNKVLSLIPKINRGSFIIKYLSGDAEILSVTKLNDCELILNRTSGNYAISAPVTHKLTYSFKSISRSINI